MMTIICHILLMFKERTQCRELPLRAGSREGCQWSALPSPVQCEETATRTRDLPVTCGKTLSLAPGPHFKIIELLSSKISSSASSPSNSIAPNSQDLLCTIPHKSRESWASRSSASKRTCSQRASKQADRANVPAASKQADRTIHGHVVVNTHAMRIEAAKQRDAMKRTCSAYEGDGEHPGDAEHMLDHWVPT